MQVFMVTNSAGELMGWAKPLIEGLKRKNPAAKITLIIPPCQYASGMEKEVAENFAGVDSVVGPGRYLKYLFLGLRPSSLKGVKEGVVVFLGGDPFHAIFVSRRLRVPAIAYIEKPRWKKHFRRFMVLDEATKEKFIARGVEPEKIAVVGDLIADAVRLEISREETYSFWHLNPTQLIVSLLPGSRPVELRFLTPFFLKVAELLREKFSQIQFLLILSPFTRINDLENLSQRLLDHEGFEGTEFQIIQRNNQYRLKTLSGLEVLLIQEKHYEAMSISDLALTLPGTNTLELASLGIPMVVAAPLNRPEAIPLEGLPELIGRLPLGGKLIKGWLARRYTSQIQFTALPNIRAKRRVVPEVRGIIEAQDVARPIIELLEDNSCRTRMRKKLTEIVGKKGAADRTVEVVVQSARVGVKFDLKGKSKKKRNINLALKR